MTRYLLDTTALVDFSKDREPARSRILAMIDRDDEVGICPVNVAEFYAGLPPEARESWDEFFNALAFWDLTIEVAVRAGGYRYEFARRGLPLSTTDALIAAASVAHGAILVTDNPKDYPMDDVRLLSLRQPESRADPG